MPKQIHATRLLSGRTLSIVGALALVVAGAALHELRLVAAAMGLVFVLVVVTVLQGLATGELPFKGRRHAYSDSPTAFIFALLTYVFFGAVLAYFGLGLLLDG